LVETEQGLVLVDTGLGTAEYEHPRPFTRIFQVITRMPMDSREAALNQVVALGYSPEDVRHIILSHMHFDHVSGLSDFPHAQVHVSRKEYDAFMGRRKNFYDLAYDRHYVAHQPDFQLYDKTGEKWFDFDAIRLPFAPEMWLIPLPGHSRGHSGVAIQKEDGWHLHCADAAGDFRKKIPSWSIRLVLGPHEPRLRTFGAAHPEVTLTASHMFLDFFDND
jgi:glyoxylase-like metal-dependent hydrolase (beta-lactamase superfamily II)